MKLSHKKAAAQLYQAAQDFFRSEYESGNKHQTPKAIELKAALFDLNHSYGFQFNYIHNKRDNKRGDLL